MGVLFWRAPASRSISTKHCDREDFTFQNGRTGDCRDASTNSTGAHRPLVALRSWVVKFMNGSHCAQRNELSVLLLVPTGSSPPPKVATRRQRRIEGQMDSILQRRLVRAYTDARGGQGASADWTWLCLQGEARARRYSDPVGE